jgi:chemotaxis protein methyltransferase CheR
MSPTRAADEPFHAILAEGYAITAHEFGLFQALIQGGTGIQLPEIKRPLLVGRLSRRLRELRLSTFGDYYARVVADPSELACMFDLVSTNETRFFREPKQFELLERTILPALAADPRRPRRLRVWSAACATGEEPYSIGMSVLSGLPGWQVDILAPHISTRVLDRARAAVWPLAQAGEIPEHYLKAYMLRGVGPQEGLMKASPELRALVRFGRVNLHDIRDGVDGSFDLIFCRNVLIYFSPDGRAAVINRLLSHLSPLGHLFLGSAETIGPSGSRVSVVGPSVYALGRRTTPLPALEVGSRTVVRAGRP